MSRSRWIPLLALGVLGAVVLLAVGPATARKGTSVKTTVTITSGEETVFTGKVTAGNKKCRAHRTVKLFNEPYTPESADKLVGTAKTNASGTWTVEGSFMAGIYHAQVTSSTVQTPSAVYHCLGDVSLSARF